MVEQTISRMRNYWILVSCNNLLVSHYMEAYQLEDNSREVEVQPILLRDGGGEKKSSGEAKVKIFTPGVRILRCVAFGVAGIFVSLLLVLVPMLHFVLVPISLLVTIFGVIWMSGQRAIILGGHGVCPFCGDPFRIMRRAAKWPFSDVCENCGREVIVEKVNNFLNKNGKN